MTREIAHFQQFAAALETTLSFAQRLDESQPSIHLFV